MTMKSRRQGITWITRDGTRHDLHAHADAAAVEVPKYHCPACYQHAVRVNHALKQTVLFLPAQAAQAEAHMTAAGGTWEVVPDDGIFRLQGENTREREYATVADAVCVRCRSRLGLLRVPRATLFGRSEDRRVMSGQCGVVISARED